MWKFLWQIYLTITDRSCSILIIVIRRYASATPLIIVNHQSQPTAAATTVNITILLLLIVTTTISVIPIQVVLKLLDQILDILQILNGFPGVLVIAVPLPLHQVEGAFAFLLFFKDFFNHEETFILGFLRVIIVVVATLLSPNPLLLRCRSIITTSHNFLLLVLHMLVFSLFNGFIADEFIQVLVVVHVAKHRRCRTLKSCWSLFYHQCLFDMGNIYRCLEVSQINWLLKL